jgi:hypothetical protein
MVGGGTGSFEEPSALFLLVVQLSPFIARLAEVIFSIPYSNIPTTLTPSIIYIYRCVPMTEVSTKILDGFPHLLEYRILRLTCRATPD